MGGVLFLLAVSAFFFARPVLRLLSLRREPARGGQDSSVVESETPSATLPRDIVIDGVLINAIGRTDDVCPGCGCTLDRRPGRTSRCPHCDDMIHVRRRVYDGARVLMSPADTMICDRQNTAFYELKALLGLAYDSPRLTHMLKEMATRYAQADLDWAEIEAYFTSTSTIHFRGTGLQGEHPPAD